MIKYLVLEDIQPSFCIINIATIVTYPFNLDLRITVTHVPYYFMETAESLLCWKLGHVQEVCQSVC